MQKATTAPLTVAQQLDLFADLHRQEQKQEDQQKRHGEQLQIKRSVMRMKAVIQLSPEIDHDCSSANCNPVNEQRLIYKGLLRGLVCHKDVFICKYGRVHICNAKYRECVIDVDNTHQGTCRISGRHYGLLAYTQVRGAGAVAQVSYDAGMDGVDHEAAAELVIEEEEENPPDEGDHVADTFSNYFEFDSASGGYYDRHGDDEDSDGEFDYESVGASSHHPFRPPSTSVQSLFVPNSKFVSKPQAAPNIATTAVNTPKIEFQLSKSNAAIDKPLVRRPSPPPVRKQRDVKPSIIQPLHFQRPKNNTLVPLRSPLMSSNQATISLEQAQQQTIHILRTEMQNYRTEVEELINLLFYSKRRCAIGQQELQKCMENARRSVTSDIRQYRINIQKNEPVLIPLLDLFTTYYRHITVNYTMLSPAPPNPFFFERTVNVILIHWKAVLQYLLLTQVVPQKQLFIQHCLTILYAMRKGGRRIASAVQVIPDCEYTRTYMPSIEYIEHFGFKKNYTTDGDKRIMQAYSHNVNKS